MYRMPLPSRRTEADTAVATLEMQAGMELIGQRMVPTDQECIHNGTDQDQTKEIGAIKDTGAILICLIYRRWVS